MRAISGMQAVDTNVLVRLIARDNSRQTAAAEAFVSKGAWVSTLVLAESMWVLSAVYDRKPEELAKIISMLLHHRDLVLQDPETVADALKLFQQKPGLGFSDCLILHTALNEGHTPLGTFDGKLAKVEGTVPNRRTSTRAQGQLLGLGGRGLPELNFIAIQVIDPGKADRRIHSFVWRQSLLPLVPSGRAKHPDLPRCS